MKKLFFILVALLASIPVFAQEYQIHSGYLGNVQIGPGFESSYDYDWKPLNITLFDASTSHGYALDLNVVTLYFGAGLHYEGYLHNKYHRANNDRLTFFYNHRAYFNLGSQKRNSLFYDVQAGRLLSGYGHSYFNEYLKDVFARGYYLRQYYRTWEHFVLTIGVGFRHAITEGCGLTFGVYWTRHNNIPQPKYDESRFGRTLLSLRLGFDF